MVCRMTTAIDPEDVRRLDSPWPPGSKRDERAWITHGLFLLAQSSEDEDERRHHLDQIIALQLGLAPHYHVREVGELVQQPRTASPTRSHHRP
jgi:hypothetical protein